jgi:aspartyl-tRNA(Asn)/glutamyl-tRNA(Gln) amidotransferase subunit A
MRTRAAVMEFKAMDLRSLSAVDLAAAIRDKKVSSVEATTEALKRAHAVHAKTNAVISFEDEFALAAAKVADASLAVGRIAGRLHGVPLAHKDMFDRVGRIPSWGAKIRRDTPCDSDATVISRLEREGSHQIAALHLTEFAFGPTGHNYVLGHAKNPWDLRHITGGSSSGSAISVATGVIPAALGSDTAGSLRLPAAALGIASLKPTWSRVSRAGAMPLSPSLDCVGPIARDVRDLALLFRIIAGQDTHDGTSSQRPVPGPAAFEAGSISGMRIGVDEALLAQADSSVQTRMATAIDVLVKAGAKKVAVKFPDWRMLDQLCQLLQLPEVASAHGAHIRKRGADFGPQVRARVEFGHFVSGPDHQTALRARGTLLKQTLTETYANCDVTILPTFADPLPTIEALDIVGGPTLQSAMGRIVLYCRPVNYLGLPALTLPFAREGQLPNGFQLVGRPFAEADLIKLGLAYQQVVKPELVPM